MTDLGKCFALIASDIVRKHGFGSTKMVVGYELIADEQSKTYGSDNREFIHKLVEMGYMRTFTGSEHINNKRRNWRYQFMVIPVYAGLTDKGWQVADKYIAELNRINDHEVNSLKARNYIERCAKSGRVVSYEEAMQLANDGIL